MYSKMRASGVFAAIVGATGRFVMVRLASEVYVIPSIGFDVVAGPVQMIG